MSCNTKLRPVAEAATQSGIMPGASQKSFYLGLAVAGTLLGGLILSRQRRRQGQGQSAAKTVAASPTRLPILSGLERVKPIPPNELSGQRCTQCHNSARHRPGPWYRLQGRPYCQDCAHDQARQAGVSLAPPVAAVPAPTNTNPVRSQYLPKRTTLKPKSIKIGPFANLEEYAVLVRGQDTGLSLTPEVKVEAGGQLRINRARWFVNYNQAGQAIAGPFESIRQAQGMASLLANLDWTRRVEEIPQEEVKVAAEIARMYRAELGFEKHMQQISGWR